MKNNLRFLFIVFSFFALTAVNAQDLVDYICTSTTETYVPLGTSATVMSPSTHGTTFGANPVVCAGANYVLDTIANDAFLSDVEEKGRFLEEKLLQLSGVKNVRRLGLMVGIEIEGDAHDAAAKCVANGLLIITAKDLLRMLPPLTITKDELLEAVNILDKTLKEITA